MEPQAQADSPNAVVTKAVIRAAQALGLSAKMLAEILGVSEATISRLKKGTSALNKGDKSYELALFIIRLYRSLDALVHGDDAARRSWLTNENRTLKGRPIDLIKTISGINKTCDYLDSRRAPI